jgi:hypothetical protein
MNDITENVTMTDNDLEESNLPQQQQPTTQNTITTAIAAGNFDHQFNTHSKNKSTNNSSEIPTGVNPNRQ